MPQAEVRSGRDAGTPAPSGPRTVNVPVEPAGAMKGVAAPEPVGTENVAPPATAKPAPDAKPEPKPAAKPKSTVAKARPAAEKGWVVQVGVFSQLENARRLQERFREKGYRVKLDPPKPSAGKPVHVEVGPYPKADEAKTAAARIQKEFGIKGLIRSE